MSAYEPPEEKEQGSSFDPGAKEKEVTEERDLSDKFYDLDRVDYVKYGVLLGFPAGVFTVFGVLVLFPEFVSTAGRLLRNLGFDISGFVQNHPGLFEPFKRIFEFFLG